MANCQVCGKPSGYFPLCKECNAKKDAGKIVKCEKCNKWHLSEEKCDCVVSEPKKVYVKTAIPCVVCGDNSTNGPLCSKCYLDKNQYKYDLPKYEGINDAREHYYNLKNSTIFNINDMDYAKVACLRLFAIAEKIKEQFNKTDVSERVSDDVKTLLERKKEFLFKVSAQKEKNTNPSKAEKQIEENNDDEKDYRKTFDAGNRCEDGHYVRSKSELIIDDFLFNRKILHVYEQEVYDPETGEKYYADFYLPYFAGGVYIEHFGLNDEKYLEKCKKKTEFFKKMKLSLIITDEKNFGNIKDILDKKLKDIEYEYTKKEKR